MKLMKQICLALTVVLMSLAILPAGAGLMNTVEAAEEEMDELLAAEDETDETREYLGNFRLTAYCSCSACCGSYGAATASGAVPEAGRTVAMEGVDFGTKLEINGHIYTVEDTGTPYGHVDIFMDSHDACLEFGEQYADVYLVEE
jgi:3D (Asp-Asp-Asp) domain-containing protein